MKILVTSELPGKGMKLLRENFEVIEAYSGREEIMNKITGTKGIVCLLSDRIDEELMSVEPELECVSVYAVGYNNVDLKYANKHEIKVTNTPDVLTEATSDLALLLLLSATRRLREGMEMMEEGRFKGWAPKLLLGRQMNNMKIGIAGAGRIGQDLIKKLSVFGSEIVYTKRSGEVSELSNIASHVSFEELVETCDAISIHTPLTSETKHMFNIDIFRKMRNKPYIINTSRGAVIKEKDLVEALERKLISGAALDVFEFEPAVLEPLIKMDNVILTPHIGSATEKTRSEMSVIAAENIISVLNGEDCKNIVN